MRNNKKGGKQEQLRTSTPCSLLRISAVFPTVKKKVSREKREKAQGTTTDGIPAKLVRTPSRDDPPVSVALEQDGLGARSGRVGERASGCSFGRREALEERVQA
jgi:hypothetical protein